jgi:hypothetical protein
MRFAPLPVSGHQGWSTIDVCAVAASLVRGPRPASPESAGSATATSGRDASEGPDAPAASGRASAGAREHAPTTAHTQDAARAAIAGRHTREGYFSVAGRYRDDPQHASA